MNKEIVTKFHRLQMSDQLKALIDSLPKYLTLTEIDSSHIYTGTGFIKINNKNLPCTIIVTETKYLEIMIGKNLLARERLANQKRAIQKLEKFINYTIISLN